MDAGGAIGCGAILLHCVVWERRERLMKVGACVVGGAAMYIG